MKIFSFSPFGYEGSLVSVEVDLRRGIPAVDLVGLADGAVKESRERMKSAIRNSGLPFPPERVLISLSPADLKKEGAGFDLAIALAVLSAKTNLDSMESAKKSDEEFNPLLEIDSSQSILVMGELELNGSLRPVRGVHAAMSTAYDGGIRMAIVPLANKNEALEVKGMKVFGAENLIEAFTALQSLETSINHSDFFTEQIESDNYEKEFPKDCMIVQGVAFPKIEPDQDFAMVKNQSALIYALQVAAAGGHNLLAFGPPGCGKTLSLQKFPSLLPLLTLEQAQSVTRIYSIAGLLNPDSPIIRKPPFRMPHQTASIEGMCGGGPKCTPGEISLAHNGVLFLDEAAEFRTTVLQMLRVPLENGAITLSRAGRATVYPASFQLLISTNPCPCGNYGSAEKICLCSTHSVEQYWRKFSGPLLDRIDIRIQVESNPNLVSENKIANKNSVSTADLREKIAIAVKAQRKRQGKKNANLNPSEVLEFCKCNDEAKRILDSATEHYGFSPRGTSSCIKLARTIADMEGLSDIDGFCMEQAVILRKTETGGMQ